MTLMTALVIVSLLCGFIGATIAHRKGGDGVIGFIAGLFLGPVGIIISLFLGNHAKQTSMQVSAGTKKICPKCAEAIQPAALVCRYCGHEFVAAEASLAHTATDSGPEAGDSNSLLLVLLLLIGGMIAGIYVMDPTLF